MHISTTASPALAGSKEEFSLQKRPSDVVWYVFLIILLSLLLLAQPDQRQSTGQKSMASATDNTVVQINKPAATGSK